MEAKLSVVIDVQNEAIELDRCLKSIQGMADEILVFDQESDDGSVKVAKKYGAKVISQKKVSHIELLRNLEISKASNKWVLILDPDEEIPTGLVVKIKELILNDEVDFYKIPRKNIVFGEWLKYSRWWPDYNIRLFKKDSVSWSSELHSVPITNGLGASFPANEESAIIHHHYNSVDDFLKRMHRYTSVQSALKIRDGYKFSWMDLVDKPSREFFSRFFFGRGYKDGVHGLAVSLLQSFSELVVYLKIWQEEKFRVTKVELIDVLGHMKKNERDLHYWQNDALVNEHNDFIARIKRKLRI